MLFMRGIAYSANSGAFQLVETAPRGLLCVKSSRHWKWLKNTVCGLLPHPSLISVMPTLPTSPNTLANFSSVRLDA